LVEPRRALKSGQGGGEGNVPEWLGSRSKNKMPQSPKEKKESVADLSVLNGKRTSAPLGPRKAVVQVAHDSQGPPIEKTRNTRTTG